MSITDDTIITCDPATSGEHEGAVTSWIYVYPAIVCNDVIKATVQCIHCARSHNVFFDRVVPKYHWHWVKKAVRDYQKALKLC